MTASGRLMKARLVAAIAAMALVSGCGIFKKGDGGKPKTAVLGERIPVLTVEEGAGTDATLAATPVTVPAGDPVAAWPQPGGNPQKAMGDVALGATPARAWTAKIQGVKAGQRLGSAPVVANGHLFVMDTRAVVHAYDAKTGGRLWETQLTGREGPEIKRGGAAGLVLGSKKKTYKKSLFGGGVSYDNGKLYATNGLGEVAEMDATNGKIGWRVTPGGPLRGAPSIANGAVYVMTQDNQLFALNQADGATIWSASGPLQSAGVFGAGAPAIARGTVIAGFSSGDLDAYRYENGRIVWQDALTRTSVSTTVGDVSDVDASPVVDDTRVYAVGAGGRAIALDLLTGQRLWELNIGGISTPALGGDWLFVVSDQAQLFCIQRTTGKVRWMSQLTRWRNPKKKTKAIFWAGPVLAGGRLVLVNSVGQIAYVAIETGKVQATVKAPGKSFSLPPIVADNTLYTLGNDGTVAAWR
jgi:outer membrane protein assembly factor BamB